jgi:hypothetical protein
MIIANYCKANVRFICSVYNQRSCVYFKPENNFNYCKYGLPDRKCRNEKAIKQGLRFFTRNLYINIKEKKWEENSKEDHQKN